MNSISMMFFSVFFLNVFTFFATAFTGLSYGTLDVAGVSSSCPNAFNAVPLIISSPFGVFRLPYLGILGSLFNCISGLFTTVFSLFSILISIMTKSPFPINVIVSSIVFADTFVILKAIRG